MTVEGGDLFPEPIPHLQVKEGSWHTSALGEFHQEVKVRSSLTGPSQVPDGSAQRLQQEPADQSLHSGKNLGM